MDDIQASPQNELLKLLADNLRKGSDKFQKLAPVAGTLAKLLMGRAPEGLESLSYGESPTQLYKANSPALTEHAGDQLDAAPFLPLGAAAKAVASTAAKASILVPILRGLSSTRAAKLEQLAELASKAQKKGATASDIWHDYSVVEPRRTKVTELGPLDAKWAHEVSRRPGEDLISPYGQMSTNDKIDFLHKDMPDIANPQTAKAKQDYDNFMQNQLPIPGNYKAGQLLDHPVLDEYPALKDVGLELLTDTQMKNPALRRGYGSAWRQSGDTPPRVAVYHGATLADPIKHGGVTGALTHELEHVVQNKWDMPGGGSTASADMYSSSSEPTRMRGLVNALRARKETLADDVANQLEANVSSPIHARYENFMGERQARDATFRDTKTQAWRDANPPGSTMGNDSSALDPLAWEYAKNSRMHAGANSAAAEQANYVVRKLRGF